MNVVKVVVVNRLSECILKDEAQAEFGKPISEKELALVPGNGPEYAIYRAEKCLGWIWRQWLKGKPREVLQERVVPFITKGIEVRSRSKVYDFMALHDLFLLHCAIFAGRDEQIKEIAGLMGDGSGDKGRAPLDNGELYAAAWCGVLKHGIMGNQAKALEQAELIWSAYRENTLKAAPKPLLMPWLKKDWPKFVKEQEKHFERLWASARKDHWTVKSENSTEIVVTTEKYQIGHMWCWSHCGLAMLAQREGADIVFDPFWFPEAAGKGKKAARPAEDASQLRMF